MLWPVRTGFASGRWLPGRAAVCATVLLMLIIGSEGEALASIIGSEREVLSIIVLNGFGLTPTTLATFVAGRLLFADGQRKRAPKRCSGCGNLNLLMANFCRSCGLRLVRER